MNLIGKSLLELKGMVEKKQISHAELWKFFSDRVEKYDKALNCFVTPPSKEGTGLAQNGAEGFPIAFKDNFNTKGIRTTASSKVLDTYIPPYNATVVEKLLGMQFAVFGKTNMDAWAHGSSTETSDYGPTNNPWDVSRAAGGSSGGSAAATAAYLVPAAIGSETAGSIRQPAAWCGLVGLKPTYGRVSRYGVIAMGSSWDCPGPITRTVEDAAYLLEIIQGEDPYDATTLPAGNSKYEIRKTKKMRIGVCKDYLENIDPDIQKRFDETVEILKKLGHEIIPVALISPKYSISVYTILQRSEVSSNLNRYDGVRYGKDRTFFGEEAKRRIMLGTYSLSHGYYDAFYKKAEKVRQLIIQDFESAFQTVDLIIAPTTPLTAIKKGEFEKYPFFGEVMDVLNEPAAAAGIPAINVPMGLDSQNLPIGLQFMAGRLQEEKILSIAYQLEQETNFMGVREALLKRYE